MKAIIAAGAMLLLAACATVSAQTPAQRVYALEGELTIAVNAASQYVGLPACGSGAGQVCSDPTVVAEIQASATIASSAILSAQAVVTDPATSAAAKDAAIAQATDSLAALQRIVPAVKTAH